MIEGNVCCNCNEFSKNASRINAGKNYYCMKCVAKINDSKMDYWKECSFEEFLGSYPFKNKQEDSETPFADHIRGIWKEMGYDVPERKRRKKKSK
tara:strand:- start:257 stop:541 length:285 start_codon:yes stop_codon:yes gene_type:complete